MGVAKQVFWILLFLGLAHNSNAQSIIPVDTIGYKIHTTHYETDNGLLQNSIKDLAFDNLGFLWMVSEKGTSRYDGRSFTHYNDADFMMGVGEKSKLLEALDSNLYLNGLSQYEIRDGKLTVKLDAEFPYEFEFGIGRQILNIPNSSFLRERLKIKPPSYFNHYCIYFFKVNDSTIYWPKAKFGFDYIVNGKVEKKLPFIDQLQNDDRVTQGYDRFFLWDDSFFFLRDDNTLFQYKEGELHSTHRFDQELDKFKIYWNKKGSVYLINKSKVYELVKANNSLSLKFLFKVQKVL